MFFKSSVVTAFLLFNPTSLAAPAWEMDISEIVPRGLQLFNVYLLSSTTWFNRLPPTSHDYDQNECPAPHPSNIGDCFPINYMDDSPPCALFCQQKVTYTYDQEQILPGEVCRYPFTCTITDTTTKTTQHAFSINPAFPSDAFKKIFQIGASYTYTFSSAKTHTVTRSVTPKEKECGYWSFIPISVTTCGLIAVDHKDPYNTCPQPKQHYNDIAWGCQTDFVSTKDSFGKTVHAGETIFVYVDCLTLAPLSCDDGTKQDPAFCAPGVALPREVAIASIKALPPAPTGSEGATLVDSAKDTGGIIQATGNPEAAKSSQVGFGASVVPSVNAATTAKGGGAGTQASCSVVTTTATGTIAPGPATYCTCGETMAGINTVTGAGGTAYSVCALGGDNPPTVGTITPGPKTSAPPATTEAPAPSSTASGESGDCPGGTFGSSAECGENCLGGGTCDCGGTALGQPICLCNCP